jgi:hypothetical protein
LTYARAAGFAGYAIFAAELRRAIRCNCRGMEPRTPTFRFRYSTGFRYLTGWNTLRGKKAACAPRLRAHEDATVETPLLAMFGRRC